ncbi:MAG: SEL1-like repeat protein [bacterium]|uniref:SEL1-like repeat protein n=1 Tax=Candidatus Aphodosoma intestinipullorum TaxID=2840674 RepID=A0A940IEF8_9BACT|nr:SEL1-like repeat protein [Candidatus Aphodosoma intestinipullorum]
MKRVMVFFVLLLSCQVMMYGQVTSYDIELRAKALDGDVTAQLNVGNCYYNGWGISQDYYQAVRWWRMAAEQGSVDAQLNVGNCYYNGMGVSQDYGQAVKWWRMAAGQGNTVAQLNLGNCYCNGHGVSQDYGQAAWWWRNAAEQGCAEAQLKLGIFYYKGRGVSQDYGQAVKWYRKAAEQGVADAQFNLGLCYYSGLGVPQDYSQAVKWYHKAAEQGLAKAQEELGRLYANGNSVPLYGEAEESKSMAAEQRNEDAKEELAWMESPDNVDANVPQARTRNRNTFAVIIANENYKRLDSVPYAKRDGQMFAEYCEKTLGMPKKNIREYNDATYGDMLTAISDIKSIAAAYRGELNVLFYYAGHGAPMEGTQEAYLLPVDSYGAHSGAALSLDDLYSELGKMGARTTTVFLDACFSGASREGGMLASARGVAVKPKEEAPTAGNVVVLSAASGEETALPYEEMKHGMFTYYLLKKLKESKGDVTLGELSDYVIQNVRQRSAVVNRKSQTPTVLTSGAVAETWRSIKLAR